MSYTPCTFFSTSFTSCQNRRWSACSPPSCGAETRHRSMEPSLFSVCVTGWEFGNATGGVSLIRLEAVFPMPRVDRRFVLGTPSLPLPFPLVFRGLRTVVNSGINPNSPPSVERPRVRLLDPVNFHSLEGSCIRRRSRLTHSVDGLVYRRPRCALSATGHQRGIT